MNYAIIGDIHSQSAPLYRALEFCYNRDLTPILLGDLFDSQCSVSDSAGVYAAARAAQRDLGAVILQSNHQFLLQQLAQRKPIPLKKDIARTIQDFNEAGVCIQEVAQWLDSFPYVVVFQDSQGLEYRLCHAELPESITVPSYEEMWRFYNPSPEELRLLLWGKEYSRPDKERFWWLARANRDWVAVAGHYHKVVKRNMSLVLDAGCGGKTRAWYDDRPPELLLYDVESRNMVHFPVF